MKKQNETKEEKFFLDNFNSDVIFRSMERTDYYFLHCIRICESQLNEGEKLYLSRLAETIEMPMSELSKAIGKLQEKSYIIWKTDLGAGKTYVELSVHAQKAMDEQHEKMKKVYAVLQAEIGETELAKTVEVMRKIREIIGRTNTQAEGTV